MSNSEVLPENISEIISEYSTDFRRIYVNGIYGHLSPSGIESIIYSEEGLIDEVLKSLNLDQGKIKLKRVAECSLLIDPLQMVTIYNWLGTKIKEYEEIFGKILTSEEMSNRIKNLNKSQ